MTIATQIVGVGYIKSLPGIIKICQEVVNFIGMICISVGASSSRGEAFLACCIIGIIVTALLLLFYITQLVTKIQIPWTKIEFFFAVAWVIFYIIVSGLVVAVNSNPYIAGGVFGFVAALLYGIDAFLQFRSLKAT